jgi:hypothetical protein
MSCNIRIEKVILETEDGVIINIMSKDFDIGFYSKSWKMENVNFPTVLWRDHYEFIFTGKFNREYIHSFVFGSKEMHDAMEIEKKSNEFIESSKDLCNIFFRENIPVKFKKNIEFEDSDGIKYGESVNFNYNYDGKNITTIEFIKDKDELLNKI